MIRPDRSGTLAAGSAVRRKRGFVAVVCIAVVLAIAMSPIASGSFAAILAPLDPLFGALVSVPLPPVEPGHPHTVFVLVPLPSRAPPAA